MIPSFDMLAYVESRCVVSRRYGKGEHMLHECPNCGDRDHCSVNPARQRWRCFHCDWSGVDVTKFVAKVESCDLADARKIIFGSVVARPSAYAVAEVAARADEPAAVVVIPPPSWRSRMPDEYVPCFDRERGRWNGVPRYLGERGITKETCALFKLGWCDKGRYAHRIIIPISTGDLVSFQARATFDTVRRYDSPDDAPMSRMLMGYDMLEEGGELWLVEGPFDKLGCHQAGIPAVPLIGKKISDRQAVLVAAKRPRAVHVMLDDDAESAARAVAAKLSYLLPPTVSVDLALLRGGDPGSLGEAELLAQAHRFTEASRPAVARLARLG